MTTPTFGEIRVDLPHLILAFQTICHAAYGISWVLITRCLFHLSKKDGLFLRYLAWGALFTVGSVLLNMVASLDFAMDLFSPDGVYQTIFCWRWIFQVPAAYCLLRAVHVFLSLDRETD